MTYVRNAWYVVAWSEDVVPEGLLGVQVLNEPVVIWRDAAGDLVAFEDRCVHRLAPLSLGRCEGEKLRCMYHGFLYGRTGRVVEIPGQDRIPNNLRLRTYPVAERHNWVWVWMGDTGAADEGLIPPAIGLDHADYILGHGQLDYDAQAHLINENLLDLSHVSFLHAASVPSGAIWARELPKFTKRERCVRTEWWIRGQPCADSAKPGELVDVYTRGDFYVPGVLLVVDKYCPVGTADALNGQEPNLDRPFSVVNHAVTPVTDRSTRYFFSIGPHRDYGAGAARKRDSLMTMALRAFAEDKKMIEAQQHILDVTPDWRFIPTRNDRGVMLFNQIVEKLAAEVSPRMNQFS